MAAVKKLKKKVSSVTFVDRAYTVDYLLKNPSSNAKKHRYVWQAAVLEYFHKEGVDLSDKRSYQKPLQGIQFAGIISIYNTLLGKKATTKKKSR